MNTPVNFEIAKLLKEKEFDLKVRSMYCEKKLYEDTNSKGNYNDVIWVRTWRKSPYDNTVSAPTIAEVIMWLYEKHGIWIQIGVGDLFHKDKFYIILKQHNVDRWDLTPLNNEKHSPYNTPTEAYEAAIEYTLNNLI